MMELECQTTPAQGEQYNLIKSLSHLSVMLDRALQSIKDAGFTREKEEVELQRIQSLLTLLKKLNHDFLEKELEVINWMLGIIDQALAVDGKEQIQCIHAQYLREIQSTNEKYSRQAADLQIHGLHEKISYWMARENIQLEKTRILIVCARGPRKDLIEKQYFHWLYSEQGIMEEKDKDYVLCVEMLPEQMSTVTTSMLLDFLRKHETNAHIGRNMLGDSNAMYKDVLGKYAPPILRKLCPFEQERVKVLSLKNGLFFAHKSQQKEKEIADPNLHCIPGSMP